MGLRTSSSSSPHLRYYGGAFGRVSILSKDVLFPQHARDCAQAIVNLDTSPLPVELDGCLHVLERHDALAIRPRQIYALPRRRSTIAADSPGSLLIKASAALVSAKAAHGRPNDASYAPVRLNAAQAADLEDFVHSTDARSPTSEEVLELVSDIYLSAAWSRRPPSAQLSEAKSHSRDSSHEAQIAHDASLAMDLGEGFEKVSHQARASGISERHFFTLFRRATGLTPRVYYNMRRFDSAFAMLLDTSLSITDLSYRLGFSAPPHFTRFMKVNTGWTPSDFRRAVEECPEDLRPLVQKGNNIKQAQPKDGALMNARLR